VAGMSTVTTPTRRAVIATARGLHLPASGERGELADASISAVAVEGDSVWALVDGRDLYRVEDDRAELVARLDDRSGHCLAVHACCVWVGGTRARLWRLAGSRLEPLDSFQSAPTSAEWHTPWGGPPDVFSMASDGTYLYVGVHVGGIIRTTDGSTWTPTIDLHVDVHQVATAPDGTVWAATGMRGLAENHDHGTTWEFHTSGLHAVYALAVAPVTGGALVAVASGHAGRDGAVYRYDATGIHRTDGLPAEPRGAIGPRQLAADGDVAVVAMPGGELYESRDAGAHWTRTRTGLPAVSEVLLRSP
jgi:hypothetical protein